ncbi:MAG: DUF962 domain-containing protein [Gammaproteobacteria bacterium]|nr:DUF962 domain-containing protein [Gammaproteobacteria bacterium]
MDKYRSFQEFYPFYLSQHRNRICRRLHFIGTLSVLVILFSSLMTSSWLMLLLMPICGYGFAWLGHILFEHNKPATFSYPIYSLIGDWVMFKDILYGKIQI